MSKNIYISIDTNNQEKISNYNTVPIQEVPNIINGCIDNIVCECLDQIDIKHRDSVLSSILSKLSFEGSATFKFINGSVLASRILKNEINEDKLSEIIQNTQSVWTEPKIAEFFNKISNISIQKNYIDNIYTVITVYKQI